jgi:ribose 5-phosphate isomerase A
MARERSAPRRDTAAGAAPRSDGGAGLQPLSGDGTARQPSAGDAASERQKQAAAERAVALVQSGMVVGLGGGSTAAYAIRLLGDLLRDGRLRGIFGIPCSRTVEALAREAGVPLATLATHPTIDLTIDGADEVDPDLNLIKGAGGAALWEKIVAQASRREVIVVDASKPSPRLGTRAILPVEVAHFGHEAQAHYLEGLGARPTLRRRADGTPFRTDEGHLLYDCAFPPIADPAALADALDRRAGIVGHGLFLGLATDLLVAEPAGVRHVTRPQRDTA